MNQTDYISLENRPWGKFYVLQETSNYKIKRIEVKGGHRLSYQYHNKRSEVWIIIEGEGNICLDGKYKKCKKNDTILIPQGMKHRIENNGTDKIVFIEIQTGEYFGEDDIVRLEDDYNR